MQKKSWAGFSAIQKIGVIIGATIQFGLLVGGLWDLAHQPADEVRGDRRFWAGFMFVNWMGPIAYFTVGRKKSLLRSCGCRCRRGAEPESTEPVTAEPADLAPASLADVGIQETGQVDTI